MYIGLRIKGLHSGKHEREDTRESACSRAVPPWSSRWRGRCGPVDIHIGIPAVSDWDSEWLRQCETDLSDSCLLEHHFHFLDTDNRGGVNFCNVCTRSSLVFLCIVFVCFFVCLFTPILFSVEPARKLWWVYWLLFVINIQQTCIYIPTDLCKTRIWWRVVAQQQMQLFLPHFFWYLPTSSKTLSTCTSSS